MKVLKKMKENLNLNVILAVGIILIALVAAYSASMKPANFGDVIITQAQQEHLTVTGSYTLYADPDEANFNIEVETQAKTAIDAQEDNAVKMDSVKKALLDEGLKTSEIVRSSYNVYPRYNYSRSGQAEIVGYTATHRLTIKTTNIDSVGKYIDVAVRGGANDVGGISFGLSDEKEAELRASALKFAAESASTRAKSMADGAGVKLGEIVQISEGYVGYQPVYSAVAERAMPVPAPAAPPTEIEPGTVELSASISVTYKIG